MHDHDPKRDPERWVQDHPKAGQAFDLDVGVGVVVAFGVGIVLVSVAAALGMWALFGHLKGEGVEGAPPSQAVVQQLQPSAPPEPRLQVYPERHLQELLEQQNAQLESWGWGDKSAGIAHVPIEEAMKWIAQQGLEVRSNPRPWVSPLRWQNPSLMRAGEVSR